MRIKRLLGAALIASVMLACNDGVGPAAELAEQPLLSNTPNLVKWGFDAPPVFSAEGDALATGTSRGDTPLLSVSSEGGLLLDSYQVEFWAVRGRQSYVRINTIDYSAGYERLFPHVSMMVTQPAVRPDGSEIAVGDSILITLSLDPTTLQVSLSPHGLIFDESNPTKLRLWYSGALGDLNGDGVVNQEDSDLESQLSVWYQADADAPWSPISAYHSTDGDYFHLTLDHFSGYAVAW